MRVAAAVEGHVAFRTLLDGGAPRLLNPRIAGPLQNPPHRGQYCVSIQFETYMARTAIVSEQASPDGSTVMNVGLHDAPAECTAGYQPFPELEMLRTKRRAAQGKPA